MQAETEIDFIEEDLAGADDEALGAFVRKQFVPSAAPRRFSVEILRRRSRLIARVWFVDPCDPEDHQGEELEA